MQKVSVSLILIVGVFLFPSLWILAQSDIQIPYFAGDSSGVDTAQGKLVIFNATKGFFLLPLSANSIPSDISATENLTFALADTLTLSDDSGNTSGLVIYRIADGMLFLNTFVGQGNESSHSASYFGEGEFAIVITTMPDDCATLNLALCRMNAGFVQEKPFSISRDGVTAVPVVKIATSTEAQSATIIADTNAPSIMSPLTDGTATSTIPEVTAATSSVTADIHEEQVVTSPF